MSALAEQPFTEYEQRFFLAEILKESSIPPADLVRIIRERAIPPKWTAMRIPNGRSVDSCVANFQYLLNQTATPVGPPQPYQFFTQPPQTPKQPPKRPSSELSPGQASGSNQPIQAYPGAMERPLSQAQTPTADMPIQARPNIPDPLMRPQFSHFATVNEPSNPAFRTGQEHPADRRGGKKRGRPSKADYEARAAEAAARGETFPPPKKARNPRTSEGGPTTGEEGEGSTGKKKGTRKPKTAPAPSLGPAIGSTEGGQMAEFSTTPGATGRRSLEGEAIAPTDQMDLDTPEGRPRSTIPETQASESTPSVDIGPSVTRPAERSTGASEATERREGPTPGPFMKSETVHSSTTVQQESPERPTEQTEAAVTSA